jgi:hypothetical protein
VTVKSKKARSTRVKIVSESEKGGRRKSGLKSIGKGKVEIGRILNSRMRKIEK